jgi:outer membrane protein assembly factor BamB
VALTVLSACSSGNSARSASPSTRAAASTPAPASASTKTSAKTSAKTTGKTAARTTASAAARTTPPDPQVGPRDPYNYPSDWPTYHHGIYRSGGGVGVTTVGSGLTKIWNQPLDGAIYGSPIVAQGHKIVVTENNTVYRIVNGAVYWSHHLGAPVPRSELPCGNIDPTGITSTPAYDGLTSTVVVVALLDHPIRHVAYGFDPTSGVQRWSRTVDVPTSVPGTTPTAMQQRGALLVRDRHVYIAYGGLAGDCSSYRGSVVALDLEHPVTGALADFTIPTSREAGIWDPPGPVVSPVGGILVADGNGATAETGTYDQSDSVLRLVSNKIVDSFTPATWREDNRDDLDLGSQGPTPIGKWVFIAGKRGTAYVLDGSHLGGIDGQVSKASLCPSYGGTATYGSTVFVPCRDGLRAVRINSDGTMTVLWHASSSITGSPVVGGGRIWTLDTANGVLYALDPATGAVKGSWPVGAVSRFATPALYKNTILLGTLTSIVCFSWT